MSVLGVLLAGGQSSRMGQDKALLTLGQNTILERLHQQVQTLTGEVWISRQHDQQVPFAASRVIADQHPGCGPLGGIAAVAEQALSAGFHALLIVPVDLPHCRASDLQPLLQAGQTQNTPVCFGHHFLPLYLPVSSAVCQFLQQQLHDQAARKSVASVFYAFNGLTLPEPAGAALTNTNTPDEWHLATREMHHG